MKIKYLLADEIRVEATGKQTLLGLYADDVVVAHVPKTPPEGVPEGTPPGIDRLAFLVNIAGLSAGEHSITGRLFKPSGAPYSDEFSLGEIQLEEGKSHTILMELKPFIITEAGVYRLLLTVDGVKEELTFEVRFGDRLP